jgi:hypothetical protein
MEESLFTGGDYKLENRGAPWIEGFARLKPGVTVIEQAQAEVSAVARRLENDYPATNRGKEIKLYPLWATPFNNAGHAAADAPRLAWWWPLRSVDRLRECRQSAAGADLSRGGMRWPSPCRWAPGGGAC